MDGGLRTLCKLFLRPAAGRLQMPPIRASRSGAAAFLLSALTALAPALAALSPSPSAAQPAPVPSPASQSTGSGSGLTPTTGLVTIESDRQIADNATGIVTATGNVRIVYPDRRVVATARQAQYFSREGRVVLSGDVEVVQADGNSVRAEQLVYLIEQERLEARPAAGQQVTSRFNLSTPPPATPSLPVGAPR